MRDARGRALGPLRVGVRRARTGQLLRSHSAAGGPNDEGPGGARPGEVGPGDSEIPPGSVPRGPARPTPYEDNEVPGAPGTPAGTPAGTPRPEPPRRPVAPTPPATSPTRNATRQNAARRIVVVDDGLLSQLQAAGDTLLVDVRSGRRAGQARVVVAASGPGACHVVLVDAPAALILR